MTLFILTETSAGYALLKSKDKKLLKSSTIAKDTETAEGVCELCVPCVEYATHNIFSRARTCTDYLFQSQAQEVPEV